MSLWGKFVAKIPNFGGFGAAFPHLENYSWTGLLLAIEHKTVDVDTAFAEFNAIVNYFVKKHIPSRTVCIKPKDPAFITPAIKYYLRKRNIAMRKGLTEKGAALGLKVKSK